MIRGRARRNAEDDAHSHDAHTEQARLRDVVREAGWVLPASLGSDDGGSSWIRIGVVDGQSCALVDPRGLVAPWGDEGPSLDWGIGAEDRWHLPSRESGVTQRRLDGAPVVETTVRVPGGAVVQRAFAALGPRREGSGAWIVVEVENRSAVPVALAWVIRPFSPTRMASVAATDVRPCDSGASTSAPHVVEVMCRGRRGDEVAAFGLLARGPSRWARCTDGTDPMDIVCSGDAEVWPMPALPLGDGDERSALVSTALVVPLPHTAIARILLTDGTQSSTVSWPGELPDAASVARGWSILADRGPRIDLPDPVLVDAVGATRRSLPLSIRVTSRRVAGDDLPPIETHRVTAGGEWGEDSVGDRMEILAALSRWGAHDSVDRSLDDWAAGQERGGGFGSVAATADALGALAGYSIASGDLGPATRLLPEVGAAIEWLGRNASRRRRTHGDSPLRVAGLDAGAVLLACVGQPEAAARVTSHATALAASMPGDEGDVAVHWETPREVAAAAVGDTRSARPSPALWSLLRQATPTWTWSDPVRRLGDDGLVQARLLTAVSQLLVADRADGVALTPWMPSDWWGQGWEMHDAPTRWGLVSYAVRWHGDRPALLWDIGVSLTGIGVDPVVTAPGLDPSWSSTERQGEALLAAVPAPDQSSSGADAGPVTGVAIAAPPRSVWRVHDPGPDAPTGEPRRSDPGESFR